MNEETLDRARPVPLSPAVQALIESRRPDTPDEPTDRTFASDGEEWIARIAGETAGGTGSGPAAYLVAVHFHLARKPDRPLREVLLARGRLEYLFEAELRDLLSRSRALDAGA